MPLRLVRTGAFLGLLGLCSGCASDPTANTEPIAAEVFWVRQDRAVGMIDHSLISASTPPAAQRPQMQQAIELRHASRKQIPDWRMHQLLERLDELGFEELAAGSAQPGFWDAVGVVRDGKTRVLSIFHSEEKRMSPDQHRQAREIYYLFQEVDNGTMGFQTQAELRPEDFQRQQEEIRRNYEEALKKQRAAKQG